jgi:hypothetical protein
MCLLSCLFCKTSEQAKLMIASSSLAVLIKIRFTSHYECVRVLSAKLCTLYFKID